MFTCLFKGKQVWEEALKVLTLIVLENWERRKVVISFVVVVYFCLIWFLLRCLHNNFETCFPVCSAVKKSACQFRKQVRSLIREDLSCRTTKTICHKYRACSLELQLQKPSRPKARALKQEKPPQWEAHRPQPERSPFSLQLEKCLHAAMKTQHSQKLKNNKK